MIVRNDWPEHWEATPGALDGAYLTPRERFFVRSHLPVPEIDVRSWRLEVSGLVSKPLSLSLAELRAMPRVTRDATLECAGNGRARYALASSSGTQWELGAVGNARWTGVRLADVLTRAGVQSEAQHVWFECADRATLETAPTFMRSVPLAKAMPDTLLAWGMNGAPLPALHGAPVRAITPGWFAMASAKWVVRLRLEATPSDNHFMARGYRYTYPGEDPATAPSVEAMVVKSLITSHAEGSQVTVGPNEVRGCAWTGDGTVSTVEFAIGDGDAWQPAEFLDAATSGAWRRWRARITLPAGPCVIRARATDSQGRTQPVQARANTAGYANNSIHRVTVHAS
jgi:DMSO/TMAO reductase YedYZ molybdopterin-dependent catalytic subunit